MRRVAALLATAVLLSCDGPSLVPLEDLAAGRPPASLDWWTPEGDAALAVLDRLDVSRLDRAQRALLQRDLWMTFDIGIALESRAAVRARIAPILRKLALPAEEIARLPDTVAESAQPLLPADLFDPNGPWALLASEQRPAASSHDRFFQWRSAFLILVRHPDGREATRKFVDGLATNRYPPIPAGMEFANVRRALLISAEGEPVASPIVESVQIRRYGREQEVVKFELRRPELRLRPLARDEVRPSYAVSFEHVAGRQSLSVPVMSTCANCHVGGGPASVQSFLNLMSMGLPLNRAEVGPQLEAVVRLKKSDRTWAELQRLWAAAR